MLKDGGVGLKRKTTPFASFVMIRKQRRNSKQRIDPMFWADEFVAGRLNGLIQDADETVLVQVARTQSG